MYTSRIILGYPALQPREKLEENPRKLKEFEIIPMNKFKKHLPFYTEDVLISIFVRYILLLGAAFF